MNDTNSNNIRNTVGRTDPKAISTKFQYNLFEIIRQFALITWSNDSEEILICLSIKHSIYCFRHRTLGWKYGLLQS